MTKASDYFRLKVIRSRWQLNVIYRPNLNLVQKGQIPWSILLKTRHNWNTGVHRWITDENVPSTMLYSVSFRSKGWVNLTVCLIGRENIKYTSMPMEGLGREMSKHNADSAAKP